VRGSLPRSCLKASSWLKKNIDVLALLIAPGTAIPHRGGHSFREIPFIMKPFGEAYIVFSIDIIDNDQSDLL